MPAEDTDIASNVFQRHKRKKVQAVADLKPSKIFLAVRRLDYSVYFRRLDREEFIILKELGAGRTLSRVLELAMHRFHAWAALGWFCRPITSNPNRSRN